MATGRTELELKFTGAPGAVAALPSSDFFAMAAPDGGVWERLSSTYYDTPEGALATLGISLRMREEGADLVQAVKLRAGSALRRLEFEQQLECIPDFPLRTGDEAVDGPISGCNDRLAPIARTVVDRWAAIITHKGATIELAVDLGRAESFDETGRAFAAPLAEVELELIAGERRGLFAFARLLADNTSLRLASGTKLDAALALSKPDGRIAKSPKLALDNQMSAADALAMALASAAERMAFVQPYITDLRKPDGIHQMRVALRRLRAIERAFRPYLKTNEISHLVMQAKGFAKTLGAARDWDVFLEETLSDICAHSDAGAGMRVLKANAEKARAQCWADAVAVIESRAFTQFLLDVSEAGIISHWRKKIRRPMSSALADFAPEALDRALKKVVKTAAKVAGSDHLADRHPLRIALKKLRYPVQMFGVLYPKEARRDYMTTLSSLQDAFGVVNDAVATQRLADIAASDGGETVMRAAGFVSGYKAAAARAAATAIDARWSAFEKSTPFWR